MSIVWPFVPQRQMKEVMEWKTEIIRCKSAEQRLCLRNAPRTSIEFDFHLLAQEVEAATVLARTYGADEFLIPFWHELTYVGTVSSSATNIAVDTTTKRYLSGEEGFIMGANGAYETFVIETVNADSIDIAAPGIVLGFAGAVVMPAYPARVKKPFQLTKYAGKYTTAEMQYILTKDYEITSANTYPAFNSSYVVTDRPLIDASRENHLREFDRFPNLSGPLAYSKRYTYAISNGSLAWRFNNASDTWAFRRWMYGVKGKQQSFYAPRWTRDFIPALDIDAADNFIIMEENNWLNDSYTGAICIVLNNGTQVYAMANGWQSYAAGQKQMDLTTVVGSSIAAADIELICRMPKMRFNSDNVEFSHLDAKEVDVRMPTMEVPE